MNEGILRIRKEIPRSFVEKHIIWKWNLLKYERVVDTNVCKVHTYTFYLVLNEGMYPFPKKDQ